MDISLRPYQQDFIDAVRAQFMHGHKRVVGVAPCGAGKTIMTGWMIRTALQRGKRSAFFVHRKELIRQTSDTFTTLGIPHGIIQAGCPMQLNLPVQIAAVQTLVKRLDKIPTPDFLICDECHHILAKSYKKVLDAYPDAFLLGVTATPERMGGITLADAFDSMVESLSVNQLIELGNLTRFKYFAPDSTIDLSNVRRGFGDYNQSDLSNVMSVPNIIGDIVNDYQRLAAGKPAICYCVDVEHSKSVADAFKAADIPAAHCDGETPAVVRERIVDDFRCGKIQILCNAELFGEGFDVPNMQAVILARPTQSLTLYIQQALRPLRPDPDDPNKVAVIIDHVQNYRKHGLPNTPHEWSLVPNNRKQKCPRCSRWIKPVTEDGKKICPACGFVFEKGKGVGFGSRKVVEGAGNISEISVSFTDPVHDTRAIIKERPTTPEDFLAIAKAKNYKMAWVAYQAMEFATSLDDFHHIAEVCGYKPGWAWHQWNDKINSSRHAC